MKVNPIFTRRICVWSLFESEDFLDLGNIIAYSHKIRHANSFLCGLFGTNFKEFSFRFRSRSKFFSILLYYVKYTGNNSQHCWELLRPCWQCCTNKRNDSQQCWDLQCVVGRIQLIRLCKLEFGSHIVAWKSCANVSNIVALSFIDHETKGMLEVVGQHCCVRLHEA